nr:hypothetical protein GCM10011355_04340 [Aquisalinus luteolus]
MTVRGLSATSHRSRRRPRRSLTEFLNTNALIKGAKAMKVRSSLKSLKNRHRDCRVVRRKGRIYVINKTQRRYKARQG